MSSMLWISWTTRRSWRNWSSELVTEICSTTSIIGKHPKWSRRKLVSFYNDHFITCVSLGFHMLGNTSRSKLFQSILSIWRLLCSKCLFFWLNKYCSQMRLLNGESCNKYRSKVEKWNCYNLYRQLLTYLHSIRQPCCRFSAVVGFVVMVAFALWLDFSPDLRRFASFADSQHCCR